MPCFSQASTFTSGGFSQISNAAFPVIKYFVSVLDYPIQHLKRGAGSSAGHSLGCLAFSVPHLLLVFLIF